MEDLIPFARQLLRLCTQLLQQKPFVYTTRQTRSLHFDLISVQSEMRLATPNELTLAYTRTMMGFLLFRPAPRTIAMIGLGGGSLPKYCYAKLPDASVLVIEINPAVIALRDLFCIPSDNDRFQIRCENGAHFVRTVSKPIDVLLVDGFDRKGQSPCLCSESFYEDCNRLLSPGGVMVVNLAGEDPQLPQLIERIYRRFPQRDNRELGRLHQSNCFRTKGRGTRPVARAALRATRLVRATASSRTRPYAATHSARTRNACSATPRFRRYACYGQPSEGRVRASRGAKQRS